MTLVEKYLAAEKLLNRPELNVERPAHKMEPISDEEKEAVGFCLSLMGGLYKGGYKEETLEVCSIIMPYHYYVSSQFMTLVADGMCSVHVQYKIEAFNYASNQINQALKGK